MIYKSVKSKSWIARLWGIFWTPMITYLLKMGQEAICVRTLEILNTVYAYFVLVTQLNP